MKLNYKKGITYFVAMFFVMVGVLSVSNISLAAGSTDIVVQINAKQEGEDIDIKNKTFYVTLFKDKDFTDKVKGPNTIQLTNAHSGTTEFSGLQSGTYYVAQTDAQGTYLEEDGVSVTCSKTDNAITIEEDGDEDSVTVVFTNDYEYNPNEVTSSATTTTATTAVTTQATTRTTAATVKAVTTAVTTRTTYNTITTTTTATNVVTDSAKTADNSHITFYSIVAIFCVMAAGWIIYDRKKL